MTKNTGYKTDQKPDRLCQFLRGPGSTKLPVRDVSLFRGGGGRATILAGSVIIFCPLVWGRVTFFFKIF